MLFRSGQVRSYLMFYRSCQHYSLLSRSGQSYFMWVWSESYQAGQFQVTYWVRSGPCFVGHVNFKLHHAVQVSVSFLFKYQVNVMVVRSGQVTSHAMEMRSRSGQSHVNRISKKLCSSSKYHLIKIKSRSRSGHVRSVHVRSGQVKSRSKTTKYLLKGHCMYKALYQWWSEFFGRVKFCIPSTRKKKLTSSSLTKYRN